MKKVWEKYDTSFLADIIFVAFIVLTFFLNHTLALIEAVVFVLFFAGKVILFKRRKEKLLYRVKSFSELVDAEKTSTFEKLKIPCCIIESDGYILWFNSSFSETFEINKKTVCDKIQVLLGNEESLPKLITGKGFHIRSNGKYFSVYSNDIEAKKESNTLLYFFDETELRKTEKEYYDSRPSIILAVVENTDEIYQNFKESECTNIYSKIEQILDDWARSFGGLCRKFSSSRMMILVEERGLSKMIAEKFSILKQIRELTYNGRPCEVTISLGVGKEKTFSDSYDSARLALDMAQSRGGDQVAIKHESQYRFFGGVSEGFEKKNKAKTRLIAKAMREIISESDNVLIMGHRFSDFDSVGSAIGMLYFAKNFGVDAKIVINRKTSLATPLLEKFMSKDKSIFITPEDRFDYIRDNTLVIVVDTHKKSFTECPDLLDDVKKKVVIDHHRKSVDFIPDTMMFYHMPNASSTCEMVTELIEYASNKPILDSLSAQALMSGIMLDTRNFVIRCGTRTFEAAAYLKDQNANTIEAKKLFSNGMDIFRERNKIIDSALCYQKVCVISKYDGKCDKIKLVTSQAADEMLNIEHVKASFVIFKNRDEIDISARSFGQVNVQLIMEELGGGGHQAMAACQIKGVTLDEAEIKLKRAIDKYFISTEA